MTAQFTPGPWLATVEDNGDCLTVMADQLAVVAGCGCCGSPWTSKIHAKANASLIAAAPELYEAVKWSLTHQDECLGDHPDQVNVFEQLLAKARGEQ